MSELALVAVVTVAAKVARERIRKRIVSNLRESDVTGQHLRQLLITPVNDIRQKLDGLARASLLTSLQLYEEGMIFLDQYIENTIQDSESSTKDLHDIEHLQTTFNSLPVKANAKGIKSGSAMVGALEAKREAREKFGKSIESAQEAISNAALKLKDRILAARVRMIGTIFKYFDDSPIALRLCKSYINQLNEMPEVLKNAKVHFANGFVAAMRRKLSIDERSELVWSVISINRVLWDYAHACNADSSYCEDWPLLEIREEKKLHPLHPILDVAVREMNSQQLKEVSTNLSSSAESIAVASNGCFVVDDNKCIKVFSAAGYYMFACQFDTVDVMMQVAQEEQKPFPSHDSSNLFKLSCVAVNDDFTIFAGSSRRRREDHSMQAEVCIFSCDGDFVKSFGKAVFSVDSVLTSMAIDSSNGRLLISDDHARCIHTFNLNGEYLSKLCNWEYHQGYSHIAVKHNGGILVTHWDHVRIYDSEGNLKIEAHYRIPLGGIAYDSDRQKVYVLCKAFKDRGRYFKPKLVQVCDNQWDRPQPQTIQLPSSYSSSEGIAVTPAGFVAVVNVSGNEVIVI